MSRGLLTLLLALLAVPARAAQLDTLPGPLAHGHSFELLSNSRYSIHSGFSDSLPAQVLANVLFSMDRVPGFGASRELYVATPKNVYRHQPAGAGSSNAGTLVLHKPGDLRYNSGSAFEIGISADRQEEVGLLVQAGLLAATAFRDTAGAGVACCPMKWAADQACASWDPDREIGMVVVYGQTEVDGLDTTLVAASSDSSLPRPYTTGPDTFELELMRLAQDSVFSRIGISQETISQILWAGYGVTPHLTSSGRQGITVPSALAAYPLAGRIYVVWDQGVDRYWNRRQAGNPAGRDHRLEPLAAGDRRPELARASKRIPSTAPAYLVVCAPDSGSAGGLQEAGFVGFQYLMQARCLGQSGFITLGLSSDERDAIRVALGLPASDAPVLVFAFGERATADQEAGPANVEITRARPAIRGSERLRVEYLLRRAGPVQVTVHDLLGRPLRVLLDAQQAAGYHSIEWDGCDEAGARLKRTTCIVSVITPGSISQHKVSVF